jgi:hypothetical protein
MAAPLAKQEQRTQKDPHLARLAFRAPLKARLPPWSNSDIIVYTVHINVYTVRRGQRSHLQRGENSS